jgi:hypothetical protein
VTEPVTVRFCAAAPAAKAIVAASVITIFLIITNDLIFSFSDVGVRIPKLLPQKKDDRAGHPYKSLADVY